MKQLVILIVLILIASQQGYSQQEVASAAFSDVIVKKRINGKLCDSCNVASIVSKEYDFNFVITGADRTPHRFFALSFNYGQTRPRALLEHTYVISQRNIGISFLPNFLQENGREIQLYRQFGGPDYKHLEFKAEQNGKVIKPWAPLSALGENNDYAILGINYPLEKNTPKPWKRTFFAGNFNLNIMDSLKVTVREIATKKLLEKIRVLRAPDTATNFIFYQVPVTSKEFELNLQNVLNTSSDIQEKDVFRGDSITIFKKDYASIGLLRFMGLNRNEVVQYSFEKKPYKWQSASSIEDERGTFIVLGDDLQAGKDHDVYLRYKSQPETIHKITIRVKKKPVEIPWEKIAVISIFLLAAVSAGFYLWNKRNKQKLAVLKRKNEDIETRLSLLSGQLNPHFLFNSLNAIQGTINSSNPEKANTYIGNVAGFMRDVMDNGKKEFISLKEELKLEEDYLKLEKERMAFSYFIAIAPGLESSLIDFPPLLFQPILENSIRHAFNAEHHETIITINISRNNNTLRIEVSDNGDTDWNTDRPREGHGLLLTRKRIAVYNEKLESMFINMHLDYEPGKGTVTTFTFQNWLA